MNNTDELNDLKKKAGELENKIKKLKTIAESDLIEKTSFKELAENHKVPPYGFTKIAYDACGPELYDDLTRDRSKNSSSSKKVVKKAVSGIMAGAMVATCVPFVAVIESVYALPVSGYTAIQSAVYTRHNKKIMKAQEKVEVLTQELNEVNEKIDALTNDIAHQL